MRCPPRSTGTDAPLPYTPHCRSATPDLDARRAALDQRSAALQREAATLDRDDLHASLDLQQRRKQHNDEALAFNAEIARHKQAIEAVNVVKQQYAANCADRAYRRADFTQLAPRSEEHTYELQSL